MASANFVQLTKVPYSDCVPVIPNSSSSSARGIRYRASTRMTRTEFLAANDGLGARIWQSYQIFDFPSMYSGIIAVTVLGVVLAWLLLVAERVLVPWRRG